MRNFYLAKATVKAIVVFFCSAFAFIQDIKAQSPVFTADNFSLKIGDKFVFVACNTSRFDTSQNGENQVWDYSYLTDITIADTQRCVLPSATSYADSFPYATIATTHSNIFGITSRNDYFSDHSGYYTWGYYAEYPTSYSIAKKPVASTPLYPFSYKSNYIDSNSTMVLNLPDTNRYTYNGADTIVADGYGILKLPDATINNVARLKVITSYSTTTATGFTFTVKTEYYYFITPNYHASLLGLAYTMTTTSFGGVILTAFTTESKTIVRASNTNEVLPLQLVSFNASLQDQDVLINWQTANEINISYFIVQHSYDGINFADIGKVYASGNSSTVKSYAAIDHSPKNGINYYRLQMVDKDGKYTYSKIIPVMVSGNQPFVIYPNPAKDILYVQVQRNVAENISLQVIDGQGKIIQQQAHQLLAGANTLLVNTSSLAKGIYQIAVKGKDTQSKMFVKE